MLEGGGREENTFCRSLSLVEVRRWEKRLSRKHGIAGCLLLFFSIKQSCIESYMWKKGCSIEWLIHKCPCSFLSLFCFLSGFESRCYTTWCLRWNHMVTGSKTHDSAADNQPSFWHFSQFIFLPSTGQKFLKHNLTDCFAGKVHHAARVLCFLKISLVNYFYSTY